MSDTELNKTFGVLANGAAKRPQERCPGQEVSVKKYGLVEVEAGRPLLGVRSAQEGGLGGVPKFPGIGAKPYDFLLASSPDQQPDQSPDQPITQAVARAYARYGQQAGSWIQRFERQGGTVHCRSGCVHCCDFPVRCSLAEALLTASELSGEQLAAMRDRAHQVIANAKTAGSWDEYFQRHRRDIGYCPLLDQQTGACTAYEVRPTRCRDTFSAMNARFCQVGTLEHLNRREQAEYTREVKANPATDGLSHYIAPLEDLSEPVWSEASRAMQGGWGLEIWGDFWVLTTLSQDRAFMAAVRAGQGGKAAKRAKALGLWNAEIVEIG